jgi:hypothetical protein
MPPRELPVPGRDPKDVFEERRRESIKRLLHSKMNEYGWCIRTGDVKGRKRGKHGDVVCLTEDALLVVTTGPGSEVSTLFCRCVRTDPSMPFRDTGIHYKNHPHR